MDRQTEERALGLLALALDRAESERERAMEDAAGEDEEALGRARQLLHAAMREGFTSWTGGGVRQLTEDDSPPLIPGYRLTEVIGTGGMGVAYLGERTAGDFDHRVAVKIVSRLTGGPAEQERLRTERRTLAGLSHPNIAQLFDGGETEDGLPYYVMEFVEGRPILDWATAARCDAAARIDLIEQAGRGIAHAHEKGVIHRDISPGNLLVGQGGILKIIDFGIAHTVTGEGPAPSRAGTEGFAPPERATGEDATTLGDVYGLGKVLERIMADVPAPRRRDLDAIIARATAADPAMRYASIAAMLADLAAWREGRLPDARRPAAGLTLLRLAMRHRVAAGGIAAAVLTLIGTSIVSTVLFLRADAAEARAQARFDEVRSLATFLLFDHYDTLDTIPGTTAAREEIARLGRDYLDGLAAVKEAPFALRAETAAGYRRLGDVMGNPITGNLGDRAAARELLGVAENEFRALLDQRPEDPDALRGMAMTLFSQAVFAFIAEDDTIAARDLARASVARFDQLLATGTGTPSDEALRLRAMAQVADAQAFAGEYAESIATQTAVIDAARARAAARPDDPQAIAGLTSALIEGAEVIYLSAEDTETLMRGIAHADEALTRIDTLAAGDREAQLETRPLALYHKGRILAWLDRYEEAAAAFREAKGYAEQYLALDPENHEAMRRVAVYGQEAALSLSHAGGTAAALTEMRGAQAIHARLYEVSGGDRGHLSALAQSHHFLAEIHETAGQMDPACREATESLRLYADMGELSAFHHDEILPSLEDLRTRSCEG